MAIRVLLCSANSLTAGALAPVFKGLNLEAEVCSDALSAIEKVTRQPFACVITDWSEQPGAAFLLKRARESAPNPNVIAVAIVDHEPKPAEMREHRLDYLLYRPITVGEAAAVLSKACAARQVVTPMLESEPEPEFQSPLEHFETAVRAPAPEDPNLVSVTAAVPKRVLPPLPVPELKKPDLKKPAVEKPEFQKEETQPLPEEEEESFVDEGPNFEPFVPLRRGPVVSPRMICGAILAAVAGFCLWYERDAFQYLAHTREGAWHVLRE